MKSGLKCLMLSLCASQAWAMTITSNTLIGVQYTPTNGLVEQYSTTGTVLDTLQLTGMTIGLADGLAILNGELFVTGTSGMIGRYDLNTGAELNAFTNGSATVENLGDDGTNLLSVGMSDSIVRHYSSTGVAGATVDLVGGPSNGWTGIDGDGSYFYLANYFDGRVYVYTAAGAFVSSFDAGFGTFALSSLAYDPGTNTVWVGNGFGGVNQGVYNFDLSGTLLGSFTTGGTNINGLDFVGGSSVPEPTTYTMLAGGLALLALGRRRRRR